MAVSNERSVLARYFCCLITSKFAPEDVIAWCQDEWRAAALERAVRAMWQKGTIIVRTSEEEKPETGNPWDKVLGHDDH